MARAGGLAREGVATKGRSHCQEIGSSEEGGAHKEMATHAGGVLGLAHGYSYTAEEAGRAKPSSLHAAGGRAWLAEAHLAVHLYLHCMEQQAANTHTGNGQAAARTGKQHCGRVWGFTLGAAAASATDGDSVPRPRGSAAGGLTAGCLGASGAVEHEGAAGGGG